ncbi:MAG: bifunctional phosphopantothenoylcysteine decarboxylase/phosphopantothenate--cysteine ligase CoaBC [Deltaproteobacteria bacterium]|nr:bifunctional phosphopantothenoylcysteine decarboxylase/phosphopantothenate--cysteine ligase CoaBC [Deltaproteobacteria bacterium]
MEKNGALAGKTVVLGVCGGIAAYKSVELLRLLQKQDARVRVVMTESATKFVGPLTFEALSGERVYKDMWEKGDDAIRHISWANEADLVVVAPATANACAKIAHGIADDPLSTLVLAVTAPVLLCPSMNVHMYENRATQDNLAALAKRGYGVIAPGSGFLACGDTGAGRLPEPADIVDRIEMLLTKKDLSGRTVLVSAGPTREFIDPVRFVSNPSSGRMGFAVARAAEHRGAEVILVTGPVHITPPQNVTVIRVTSALEMADAVFAHAPKADIVVKTAAVSDYRPEEAANQKIKGSRNCMTLSLCPNPDILAALGENKRPGTVLVGFAAETEKLARHATEKLKKKNLDIIAANLIGAAGSGFSTETNRATLFFRDGTSHSLGLMSKASLAHHILDKAVLILHGQLEK